MTDFNPSDYETDNLDAMADDYAEYEEWLDSESEYDDSMDGDFDSAMESAGFGYDEQYEHYDGGDY